MREESAASSKKMTAAASPAPDSLILEGILTCTDPACMAEYPILDGIPLLVPDVRGFIARNASAILDRSDLSEPLESLVGDCCGPQSEFDLRRQHLGSYAFDHYGDLDPRERSADNPAAPGSVRGLLHRGMQEAVPIPSGPILETGCAVGRTTLELAQSTEDLVLGVDLNFDMLRLASRALSRGIVRYPRRRIGMVYDRREFPVSFPEAHRVDFWACDATALPTVSREFALVVSLNLLDCVGSPVDHLREIGRVLTPEGRAILCTPYDWSPAATPVEGWIGGHSQRSVYQGDAEPLLRRLLAEGDAHGIDRLDIRHESTVPWSVRVHERAAMRYRSHLVILEKTVG
jgi:SAM-dependent methyltransferase/uncharacterized protein YbaR (Trm112 family)